MSAPAPDFALQLAHVARKFGPQFVLRDVSLDLPAGEVGVLFGGNGAGKTTLLRVVAGLLSPSRGDAIVSIGAVRVVVDALERQHEALEQGLATHVITMQVGFTLIDDQHHRLIALVLPQRAGVALGVERMLAQQLTSPS
jgi:ABC-type sulfate/molybdate transport systems ATPase subunit